MTRRAARRAAAPAAASQARRDSDRPVRDGAKLRCNGYPVTCTVTAYHMASSRPGGAASAVTPVATQ